MWKKLLIGAAGGVAGTLAMDYYWKGSKKLHGKDPRKETRPLQDDIEPIEVLESHKEENDTQSGSTGGGSYASGDAGGPTAGGLRSVGSTPVPRGRTKTGEPSEADRESAKRHTRRRRAALPILRPEARYRPNEASTEALGRIIYEAVRGREPSESTKRRLSSLIHWGYGTENGAIYAAGRAGREDFDVEGGLVFGALMWLLGDEFAVPALGLSAGPQKYPLKQHIHRLGAHLAYGVTTAVVTQALWKVFGDDTSREE